MRRLCPGVVLLMLFLYGCAVPLGLLPVANPEKVRADRERVLSTLEQWEVYGSIALRTEERRWSATIRWQQYGDNTRIDLSGPFGQGAARISARPGHVELLDAHGKRHRAQTMEALLEQEFGWLIPLSGMGYWVRGLSAPELGPATHTLDPWGRVATLHQAGWTIRYARYTEGILALPTRITASRSTLEARFVVKRWNTDLS